jgi:hypothetical protein
VITDEELKAMKERLEDCTPGPWHYDWGNWAVERQCPGQMEHRDDICLTAGLQYHVPGEADWPDTRCGTTRYSHADGEFIAHSRTDMEKLIAEVERLKAREAKLEKSIARRDRQYRQDI